MPIVTGVQGYSNQTQQTRLCLENSAYPPGEQPLLTSTAAAATMSLTNQPSTYSPTTGMHLHVFVIGNTSTGTINFVGTGPSGAVTSITYHVAVAPQNGAGYTEFTTKEAFLTVTASSITVSGGLIPSQIMIFGSYASKYLIPINIDPEEKFAQHVDEDKRGILFKSLRVIQLTKDVQIAKLDADLYPDSLWAFYMAISNTPSAITTVPASPTVLLASTAIAASMTLTTGPAAPGEFMIFSITGNTASGTIVLGGSDQYGMAYGTTETITFTSAATQTVYSTRRYSVVNNGGANKIVTTGGTSSSIAVTGVYAWTYAFTWDGLTSLTPYAASLEAFNGVMGIVLPGTILTDLTLDWQKEKPIMLQSKGMAQDYCIVGDPNPTTYPSGTNPFATLTQPTSLPYASWPASFFIDSATGAPFTTQDGSMLSYKLAIATGRKWNYAGDGMQRASYVTWDSAPDFSLDCSIIFQNFANYLAYFKQDTPFILSTTFTGRLLGSISSTTYYEQIQITLPVKVASFKPDQSKSPVEGTLKLVPQYDFSNLGYAYKIAVTAQQPPIYTV